MNFSEYVNVIRSREQLSQTQAEKFLGYILDDASINEAQIAEALTLLTKKKVTVDEVTGFIAAMRARMVKLPGILNAVDTCGTGGDKSGTFNVSTAASIVLAAGGVKVAKHGNRAATSKCGSADVLEALKLPTNLSPDEAAEQIHQNNFAFLFAPLYHPSLKRLAIIRKQLGFPTVFNLLGPLLNPAGVRRQVIGTFSLENAELLANVMAGMDYQHAIVLTSQDGLDEASLSAPVNIWEIKGGKITESQFNAADFNLESAPLDTIKGDSAEYNANLITAALRPASNLSAAQRIIVLNAGIGFYIAGNTASIEKGVNFAVNTILSGAASKKLKELQTQ